MLANQFEDGMGASFRDSLCPCVCSSKIESWPHLLISFSHALMLSTSPSAVVDGEG